jgi:hypothetical protein
VSSKAYRAARDRSPGWITPLAVMVMAAGLVGAGLIALAPIDESYAAKPSISYTVTPAPAAAADVAES